MLHESRRKPVLLLTDMVMPEMSGAEVAAQAALLCPGIRVLFMSGYTEHAVIDQGRLGDSANFIHKPFSADDLAKKIRQVLDSNPRCRDNRRRDSHESVETGNLEG